jgi:probable HAF family extracellular repeat protein
MMNKPRVAQWIAAAVLVACSVSPAAAQASRYRVVDLGQLDGSGAIANGINANGDAVGSLFMSNHETRVVKAPSGSVFQLVPGLEFLPGGAEAVNARGDIAASVQMSPSTSSASHAIRVTAEGTLHDLGTLGGDSSYAFGINSTGDVSGWSYNSAGVPRAFVARAGGIITELGSLAGASAASFGGEINDAGQIAGHSDTAIMDVSHAFRYTPGVGIVDLSPDAPYNTRAEAINANGQVVGNLIVDGALHAYRYTDGVGMVDLDTVPTSNSAAFGVNTRGEVVGYMFREQGLRAFVYRDDGGMVDLNTVTNVAAGWVLSAAFGINDAGEIVGQALVDGEELPRAFKLVPEPADSTPPVISSASASPSRVWPPDDRMVPVQLSLSVADNVDSSPRCSIESVVHNETADTRGDFVVTGPLKLFVRAARNGWGSGRTYSVGVSCADAAGNVARSTVTVRVPHDSDSQ